MAYRDSYNQTFDADFTERVRIAVLIEAKNKFVGITGTGTADMKRLTLAKAATMGGDINSVTHTPDSVYENFVWVLAALDTTVSDSAVQTKVSQAWDYMAGVDPSDT